MWLGYSRRGGVRTHTPKEAVVNAGVWKWLKIETAISVSMGSPLKAVGPSRSPDTRKEPLGRQLWPFGTGRLKTSGKDSGMGD